MTNQDRLENFTEELLMTVTYEEYQEMRDRIYHDSLRTVIADPLRVLDYIVGVCGGDIYAEEDIRGFVHGTIKIYRRNKTINTM
jgi:hypothetical protein